MLIVKQTSKSRVYGSWLKSELFKNKARLSKKTIALIQNPDYRNRGENEIREDVLSHHYDRDKIIETLPTKLLWFKVKIEKKDIEKLFMLPPAYSWFMDTGGTFKLSQTLADLFPFRGCGFRKAKQSYFDNYRKVHRIIGSRINNLGEIIMIASSRRGPFTLIDGTHRAAALLRMNKLIGAKGFLGISEDLSRCGLSIERRNIKKYILMLHRYAEMGLLW